MATLASPPTPLSRPLTYEDYMAEGEIEGRYSITDGVRIFMASPSWRHQRTADAITETMRIYERATGVGMALSSPFDILIRRRPLRTRQPDVLFISHVRLAQGGGIPDRGPVQAAPELIVEIVSDTETEADLTEKLADYTAIGVQEAWIVRPETRTVELQCLREGSFVTLAGYGIRETLQSHVFPGLALAVAACFAP